MKITITQKIKLLGFIGFLGLGLAACGGGGGGGASTSSSTTSSSSSTTSSGGADLVVTLDSASSTGTAGGNISVSNTTTNQGTAAVTVSYRIGVYLSTNNIISTADTLLAYFTDNTFPAAGGSSTGSSSAITLPSTLATGTYYIGLIADDLNVVSESNESNNASSASAISITGTGGCSGNDTLACADVVSLYTSYTNTIDPVGDVDWLLYTMT